MVKKDWPPTAGGSPHSSHYKFMAMYLIGRWLLAMGKKSLQAAFLICGLARLSNGK